MASSMNFSYRQNQRPNLESLAWRNRSFIIRGLPELPESEPEEEHRRQNYLAALDIIRYLGISDELNENLVQRAGIVLNGRRHLMVTLETVESRDLLLSRAHFLARNPSTSSLRLEAALSPAQWLEERQRRPSFAAQHHSYVPQPTTYDTAQHHAYVPQTPTYDTAATHQYNEPPISSAHHRPSMSRPPGFSNIM